MAQPIDLGTALRGLRRSRGLSLAEASVRAGTSKAALSAWENGTRRPRGPALDRLLDALNADLRTKALLLHLADPGQARLMLAQSPLGVPVDVGMVLRAMRQRREIGQADLAQQVGVTQATISRWESGHDTPSLELLHALSFALGASAEEAIALASANGTGTSGLPNDPEAVLQATWAMRAPKALNEVVLLGWEAELWRRSTRDARWDRCLALVLSARACFLVGEERNAEVAPIARRAIRLAQAAGPRLEAVPAVGSLAFADRDQGRGPAATTELAADWAVPLPDSPAKAWMLRTRGMGLIRMGDLPRGIEWVVRSSEMDLDAKPDHPEPWSHRAEMLVEAYLAAGDIERAAEILGGRRERFFPSHLFVQVEHGMGRAVSEAEMTYLRFYTHRHDGSRLAYRRLLEIERRQAWLTGERNPPLEGPVSDSDDPHEGDRLWSSVLAQQPK